MFGTDGSTELGRKSNFVKCCENTRMYGDANGITELPDWTAAVRKIPLLACDPSHYENKANFHAIYDSNAGWVDPNKAMLVLLRECQRLGVTFISGTGGTVKKLLTASDRKTVCGVWTENGQEMFAEKIILATGSYSDTLLDFKSQLQAVGNLCQQPTSISNIPAGCVCCHSRSTERGTISTVQTSARSEHVCHLPLPKQVDSRC